jgi:hypothetical protein
VRWAEFVERMGKTRDKHELLVQETWGEGRLEVKGQQEKSNVIDVVQEECGHRVRSVLRLRSEFLWILYSRENRRAILEMQCTWRLD